MTTSSSKQQIVLGLLSCPSQMQRIQFFQVFNASMEKHVCASSGSALGLHTASTQESFTRGTFVTLRGSEQAACFKRLEQPPPEGRDTCLAVLLHEGFCSSGVFKYLTVYCRLLNNNIKLYIYLYPYAKITSELTPICQVLLFVCFLSIEGHLKQT